jgi:hypothetical protein
MSAIPFAVIGGLTRFHAKNSTRAQRVWTMGWLSFGTFIGAMLPMIIATVSQIDDARSRRMRRGYDGWDSKIGKLTMLLPYSAFAIGGMVVVGQMLVGYGSCNALS